jgi:hypothetical protein
MMLAIKRCSDNLAERALQILYATGYLIASVVFGYVMILSLGVSVYGNNH